VLRTKIDERTEKEVAILFDCQQVSAHHYWSKYTGKHEFDQS